DALRRQDIPPYELAAAGGGDPTKAPPELVAVLGDSRMKHWSGITALAFTPDGKTVVSGSAFDGSVVVWDAATGERRRTFPAPVPGDRGPSMSLVVGADGKTLAAGWRSAPVQFWDLETGKGPRTLENGG